MCCKLYYKENSPSVRSQGNNLCRVCVFINYIMIYKVNNLKSDRLFVALFKMNLRLYSVCVRACACGWYPGGNITMSIRLLPCGWAGLAPAAASCLLCAVVVPPVRCRPATATPAATVATAATPAATPDPLSATLWK